MFLQGRVEDPGEFRYGPEDETMIHDFFSFGRQRKQRKAGASIP
jgi:hypothetical protein